MKNSYFVYLFFLLLTACSENEQLENDEFYEIYSINKIGLDLSSEIYNEGDDPIAINAFVKDNFNRFLTNIEVEISINGELFTDNTFTPLKSGFYIVDAKIPSLKLSVRKRITSIYLDDVSSLNLRYNGIPYLTTEAWSTLANFTLTGHVNYVGKRDFSSFELFDQSSLSKLFPNQSIDTPGVYSIIAKIGNVESNPITIEVRAPKDYAEVKIPLIFHFINRTALTTHVNGLIDLANNTIRGNRISLPTQNPNKVNLNIKFYLAPTGLGGQTLEQPGIHIIRDGNMSTAISTVREIALQHYWNPNQYLNVYVADMDFSAERSTSPSGFAFFTTLLNYELPGVDVVSEEPEIPYFNSIFMNNQLNVTTFLHEFGHIMNLHHNFNFACEHHGDFLNDTYAYDRPANLHCDPFPFRRSNIMDYGNGRRIFTYDQAERIRRVIEHGLFIPTPRNMKKSKSEINDKVLPIVNGELVY